VEERFVAEVPERLIGNKANDSDRLDDQLRRESGIEMIAPHRSNRRADRKTQDGRMLPRYLRRWKIERMFSWLYNFRRLAVRWEYHAENYLGLLQLACALILLRHS
jgi:transposase